MDKKHDKDRVQQRSVGKGLWLILFLPLALAAVVFYARFSSGADLRLVAVQQGGYAVSAPAQGLVVRGEHLLEASQPGYFVPSVEEGSKVAAGTAVGYIADTEQGSSGVTVSSGDFSGIVSFQIDGWESILNSTALESSDRSALITAYEDGSVAANASINLESTAASRSVAKIVDNLDGYRMLIWLETPPHPYVSQGQVELEYTTDAEQTRSLRVGVEENGMLADGRYYLLLNVPSTALELLYARHLDCRLLGASCSGLALPEAAVQLNAAGEASVWLVELGKLTQKQINIIGQYDGYYYTDADIKTGALVATDVAHARPGREIRQK